jgi:hypothetical protein
VISGLTNWRVDVFLKSSNDLLSFNHVETSLIILLLIFFFFSKKNNELKIIKYSSISFYKTKSNIYITYVQSDCRKDKRRHPKTAKQSDCKKNIQC